MSQKPNYMTQDERAEIGIGTMIVFIATILVSAVAAGVLINTSQKLQAKSQQTGNEATQNVASALNVIRVDGILKTAGGDIDQLDLTVQLASGADPVDLNKLVILVDTADGQVQLNACKPGGVVTDEDAEFAMDSLRGNVADCGVMNAGDLVQLHLGEAATPLSIAGGLANAVKVSLSVIPAHGTSAMIGFTTPDGFGDATHLSLF
jgi:flagellin FlaB